MTTQKRYFVTKTVCRILSAEMTKSGKAETITGTFYYKGGAWVAEWIKEAANLLPLARAKAIVSNLNNDNFDETFDWILAK